MSSEHVFSGALRWHGGAEVQAEGVRLNQRFVLEFPGKPAIEGASPAVFKGDDAFHNPETLMVASLMACHQLTYLAVCERAGIALTAYSDHAEGRLGIKDGKMRMVEVVLRPQVLVTHPEQRDAALAAHAKAHANCFMSNSVNFDVKVEPSVTSK